MVKKLVALIAVLLALMVSVNATVVVWSSEIQIPALEKLAADFEKDFGIKVEVQQVNFGQIKPNFLTAAPAGEGPDVIIGAHDWIGELAANGLLEPIPFLPDADKFYESALGAFTYNGKLVGVPYAIESLGIIYNKDLVDEVPTTMAQLEEMAEEVADDEVVGFVYNVPDFYFSFPFIGGKGGYIFKDTPAGYDVKDIGLNNEGAIEG